MTQLTPREPVVTLTRVQSGVGALRFEAVCAASVGDLRLGCAWEFDDDTESIVTHALGPRAAPAESRRPVVLAGRAEFEHLTVDLRQARSIRRLLIFAFSESNAPLNWGGGMVITSYGTRLEFPLDLPPSPATLAVASVYNVDGEFVVRAEMDLIAGAIREVCRAFGFDRITWMDERTPAS